jgi:hypothetical protein
MTIIKKSFWLGVGVIFSPIARLAYWNFRALERVEFRAYQKAGHYAGK